MLLKKNALITLQKKNDTSFFNYCHKTADLMVIIIIIVINDKIISTFVANNKTMPFNQ